MQSRWSPNAGFFQPAVSLAGTEVRLVRPGSLSGIAAAPGNACDGHNTARVCSGLRGRGWEPDTQTESVGGLGQLRRAIGGRGGENGVLQADSERQVRVCYSEETGPGRRSLGPSGEGLADDAGRWGSELEAFSGSFPRNVQREPWKHTP